MLLPVSTGFARFSQNQLSSRFTIVYVIWFKKLQDASTNASLVESSDLGYTLAVLNNNGSLARIIRNSAVFFIWGILFALAYSQSPLYTSNQNQYFLHGLAQAGVGELSADWLANTLDPTPVFSVFVTWIYSALPYSPIFYAIYGLLLAIYLFSIEGIITIIYRWSGKDIRRTIFVAGLLVIHSAGWRFGLSRILSPEWSYVLEDGFAGQRMLGTVLQPSAFGVFLLLSIYLYLRDRAYLAVLAAVFAATVHPTYILGAGVLTGCYMLDSYIRERRLIHSLSLGLLGLLCISPVLYNSLNVFLAGEGGAAFQAREILVYFRIPHHAVVSEWFTLVALTKMLLILSALFAARRSRLFLILAISNLVLLVLTIIQVTTGSTVLALLFPWRLSIYILPLSTAILFGWLTDRLIGSQYFQDERRQKILLGASYGLIAIVVVIGVVRFTLDLGRKTSIPEYAMQAYVAQNLQPGQTFLTPIKMQDFRIATGAPVYVDFKSIPYRADEVIEWYRRIRLADRFYQSKDCGVLESILEEEVVSQVVSSSSLACSTLDMIYQDDSYLVYRVDR